MNIKIEKLDGRHALNELFTHRVNIKSNEAPDVIKFIEIRNWLWEQYGPGLEHETAWTMHYFEEVKARWAWRIDNQKFYIYLKEDVLTHFSLKYLNT